jgi:hypothetical protein
LVFRLENYMVVTLIRGRSYRTEIGILEFTERGLLCVLNCNTVQGSFERCASM